LTGDPAGTGVIRLHRQHGFSRNRWRAYRVRIDGSPVGRVAAGETTDFPVPAGEHRVRLTVDRFWGTPQVMLQVREGELAEFTCHPGAPWLTGLIALVSGAFTLTLVSHHALWGVFAELCSVFALVLVRHRCIRLDGPAITSLSTAMPPRAVS
jgi:hypothetical protein